MTPGVRRTGRALPGGAFGVPGPDPWVSGGTMVNPCVPDTPTGQCFLFTRVSSRTRESRRTFVLEPLLPDHGPTTRNPPQSEHKGVSVTP